MRGAIGPCPKRLLTSPALWHAIVLVRFPLKVSHRPRGLLLSTSPFSKRDRTRAYAAHSQMPSVCHFNGLWGTILSGSCVLGRAISTHNFPALMLFKPSRDGFD